VAELRQIVWLALVAGVLAGAVVTAAQWFTTIPLILEAERYEQPSQEAEANGSAAAHADDHKAHDHKAHDHKAHDHEAHDHESGHDGTLARTGNTLLFNVLAGIGFGLLLSALLTTLGVGGIGVGLALGLCAFLVVGLAPALGLPPELPGTVAAPLFARQAWWVSAAVASAAGLALLVFSRRNALRLAGVALLLAPHLIGAPHPDLAVPGGPPVELEHRFIAASLGCTLLFWLVLGGTLGWLHARGMRRSPTTAVPGPA
jgi:cobalt transporter subunit CbtA